MPIPIPSGASLALTKSALKSSRHETVAQEFVDHAPVFLFHDFNHGLEKSIEKIDDRFLDRPGWRAR
jgi:hypothetical protein